MMSRYNDKQQKDRETRRDETEERMWKWVSREQFERVSKRWIAREESVGGDVYKETRGDGR
jgi:hypothetical protein